MTRTPLLEVSDLSVAFRMYDGGVAQRDVELISDLAITVPRGEILAIVGSSGSGKSLLAHAILGLLPANARVEGEVRYEGQVLDEEKLRSLRGTKLALIPQSVAFLDPLMRVGKQVQGPGRGRGRGSRQRRVFERLGLPPETERLYPFQLSGGMARRALFSTAVVADADVIIADEPTPGMEIDQALEALAILRELADAGKGVVLITHDLDLAVKFAERVAVFYAGTVVEEFPARDFSDTPARLRHPYTKALWHALPQHDFEPIEGDQPAPGHMPPGCVFSPRCPVATEICSVSAPPTRILRDGAVRCFHAT